MGFVEFFHGKTFSGLHKELAKKFLDKADYLCAMSSADKKMVEAELPGKKVEFWIEPPYSNPASEAKVFSKKESREWLGVKDDIILFFGFIRPYKGLIYLIRAMPRILKDKPNTKLVIQGVFWKDRQKYFDEIEKLNLKDHILIREGYVAGDDRARVFYSADVVVMPYLNISESAIIPLSWGFGVPVICTAVGGNVDWITDGKEGYLTPPKDPEALAKAVLDFYDKKMEPVFKENMNKRMEEIEWSEKQERVVLGNF
ncbi:MAG: glycosyltransferase [Candidatus Diapherotrites archaeon]|nr:glycosyltransferase [Candidatus Diapherotrites archaeon]